MMFPLVTSIFYQEPLTVFAAFAETSGAVLLDSAQLRVGCGRYTFIALEPFQTLRSKNGVMQLGERYLNGDPWEVLQTELAKFPLPLLADLPPFQGGVAGYFAYDLVQHLEVIPCVTDAMQFPDLILGFYDLVMAFDGVTQEAWIFASGYPAAEDERMAYAKSRTESLVARLAQIHVMAPVSSAVVNLKNITSNFSAASYSLAVEQARDYILAGDIFEVNIAQCFTATMPRELKPFDLYRRLCSLNPAPFAAFLHFDDVALASASPERFLQLLGTQVEARPIKGTRARGATPTADAILAMDLQQSEKDHAENVMIVDLLRNDLSRVCRDHSVQVPQLCGLESYATVHHLVSVVIAELQENRNAIDLLRATFPGGSITGAPKIRAMEIIAEIENLQRGPYCGSIGYIAFNGAMDTSITIRTFAMHADELTFQAGGAIVADSNPAAEYVETLTKARALLWALAGAQHDFVN
jgi:para-aminobenzoate synthetase component 1